MALPALSAALGRLRVGQTFAISLEIFDALFPPGAQSVDGRANAYANVHGCGFVWDHDKRGIAFTKNSPNAPGQPALG